LAVFADKPGAKTPGFFQLFLRNRRSAVIG
jgi:hypothetical protein